MPQGRGLSSGLSVTRTHVSFQLVDKDGRVVRSFGRTTNIPQPFSTISTIRKPAAIVAEFEEALKRGETTQEVVEAIKRATQFAVKIGLPLDYTVSSREIVMNPADDGTHPELLTHGITQNEIDDAARKGLVFRVVAYTDTCVVPPKQKGQKNNNAHT